MAFRQLLEICQIRWSGDVDQLPAVRVLGKGLGKLLSGHSPDEG